MALNTCKMWSNGVKTAFFQKVTKNCPDPHCLRRLGAPPPDPLNDTFELQYTFLLNTSLNLDIYLPTYRIKTLNFIWVSLNFTQLPTFGIKTLNFTRVMRLNWLAIIKLKGPMPPGSILLLEAHSNWRPFKYYCRGHFQIGWQTLNSRVRGPRIDIICWGPI